MTGSGLPAAHDTRLQRTTGEARLALASGARGPRIDRLYQEGAAKIRLPAPATPGVADAVLINTAGGLTGGDSISWEVDAGAGCSVTVSSQACEKIYRSAGGHALVETRLSVGHDAFLSWLPQETILFDASGLDRRLEVEIVAGGRALVAEAVVFGRLARGEAFASGFFRERWRITYDGREVHREDMKVAGDPGALLDEPAVLGGGRAMACVLYVGPGAEDLIGPVRRVLEGCAGAAASAWQVGGTGKLLARVVAGDGYDLRKALVPVIDVLNGPAGLPKVWSI